MRNIIATFAAAAFALPLALPLHANEAEFLQTFDGNWTGGGQVRLTPKDNPVNVSCRFDGLSTAASASLDGSCTGMILFTREIAAQLEVIDGAYAGTYVGSRRGTGQLMGTRTGSGLDLTLEWPGHPVASMTLSNPSDGRMVLTTVENHPDTGEPVVTAQLELQRQ
ncbi:MAG: hypothetical protein MEQ84_11350 [Mesorhizobium sp.]|nr:hypothetical protein [Mesorhizobium sp.]